MISIFPSLLILHVSYIHLLIFLIITILYIFFYLKILSSLQLQTTFPVYYYLHIIFLFLLCNLLLNNFIYIKLLSYTKSPIILLFMYVNSRRLLCFYFITLRHSFFIKCSLFFFYITYLSSLQLQTLHSL